MVNEILLRTSLKEPEHSTNRTGARLWISTYQWIICFANRVTALCCFVSKSATAIEIFPSSQHYRSDVGIAATGKIISMVWWKFSIICWSHPPCAHNKKTLEIINICICFVMFLLSFIFQWCYWHVRYIH